MLHEMNEDASPSELPKVAKFNKNNFLNRTTIIYGPCRSGKRAMIKYIMALCKDNVISTVITVPENVSSYPNNCVLCDVDAPWLEHFLNEQKQRVELHHVVNKIATLAELFALVASPSALKMEADMIAAFDELHEQLTARMPDHWAKYELYKAVEADKAMRARFYKNVIRQNLDTLINLAGISPDSSWNDQRLCLEFLDFNPQSMLVIDGRSRCLLDWGRSSACKDLFFHARRLHVTLVISDSDPIDSRFWRNAHIHVFTTARAAIEHFSRTSSGYPADIIAKSRAYAAAVFDGSRESRYRKLICCDGEFFYMDL